MKEQIWTHTNAREDISFDLSHLPEKHYLYLTKSNVVASAELPSDSKIAEQVINDVTDFLDKNMAFDYVAEIANNVGHDAIMVRVKNKKEEQIAQLILWFRKYEYLKTGGHNESNRDID